MLDYWFDRDVAGAEVEESVSWFETIVAQDVPLCNAVQIGCESGLLDRGSCTRSRSAARCNSRRC